MGTSKNSLSATPKKCKNISIGKEEQDMDYFKESLKKHEEWNGKIEVVCRAPLDTAEDLSLAYTPGVAEPCLEIQRKPEKSFSLTRRGNLVAVVTDGSAVLGLGNIGAEAAMPVMEGKCALFKRFADVDAFPICVKSNDVDEIVKTVSLISGSFGGINLEDISAPRCFEIESKLKEICDIPIFHDDRHGTAAVTLAALINALKLVHKDMETIKVVINGAGAAGVEIARLLHAVGAKDIIICDTKGAIYEGRENLNPVKTDAAKFTNREMVKGKLSDAVKGADVFVGVSAPNCLTEDDIKNMAKDPIIFAMANPVPEIDPELAKKAGAAIVGTGRSDYPNQINNVLAFPGIFRGALDVIASDINLEMKLAAARAIASCVTEDKLNPDYIIPSAFDEGVSAAVAAAVAQAAKDSKVALGHH